MKRCKQFLSELDSDIREHIDRETEDNIARGLSPEEARRRAFLKFGNVAQIQEDTRRIWTLVWLEQLAQDLRFALRTFRKAPGFTFVAVLTLALGIGANSAIFSLVNSILLRPLPYAQPERLVTSNDSFPQGALAALRARLKTMEVAGYLEGQNLNLTGLGQPERVYGTSVSANFFSVLGANAERGRIFVDGEDQPGKDDVVILSHELWQTKFGGDPNIIGRSITLEGIDRRILGVMPQTFRFGSPRTQFWVPLHLDSRSVGAYWGGGFMPLIGRLRPGATLEQARNELYATVPQVRTMFPWRMPDALWSGAKLIPLQEGLVGNVSETLLILLGAIALVLLIACANVANLLLARAAVRQREMAVRSTLGGSRSRICRQLLTESLLLATCGATLGLLLALAGVAWLKTILPADTPRLASVTIDWRVVAFTAAVAILTSVIFGLTPALYASRVDFAESLKTGGQQATAASAGRRLRSVLAIAEVAIAVVLVIGAGLLARSLWQLAHVNPGFRAESVVTARITPNDNFCAVFARCSNFFNGLLAQTRALPGVEDAALTNVLPLGGLMGGYAADVEGHPRNPSEPAPVLWESVVTPDYFRIMGVPLLRGRLFTPADSAPGATHVTIVTSSTVKKFWPNEDPLGKHVKRTWMGDWITVIGVVGDVNEYSMASRLPEYVDGAVYDPYGNDVGPGGLQPREFTLVVKMAGSAGNFADELRKTVSSLNADVPVTEVATLGTIVSGSLNAPRSTMSLFAIFAALALALGAIGIYGVVSYSVAQRTAEFGMRMALGAQKRDILRLILSHAGRIALIGVAIGLAGAFAATRLMASLLYGISASDPLTFAAVAILLAGVTLAASYIPARRAMKVDPMVALRYE